MVKLQKSCKPLHPHFRGGSLWSTSGTLCPGVRYNCPGWGDMLEVFTPKVVNFLPFNKVKENGLPSVESNCTEMLVHPLKHDGSG